VLKNIKWLGHASFKIVDERTIYIDPWNLKEKDQADIVLVTHPHYDHLSPEDISKVQSEETVIVTTADGAEKLKGNIKKVKPGDFLTVKGVEIEVVPAYNIGKSYHPKEKGWVGFIIKVGEKRIKEDISLRRHRLHPGNGKDKSRYSLAPHRRDLYYERRGGSEGG